MAFLIAFLGNKSIMDLVEKAWGAFGAAFGPAILLSLYWKRFNYAGAISGIISGFVVDLGWAMACGTLIFDSEHALLKNSVLCGLYEIIPGFLVSLLVCVVVTKCTAEPGKEVEEMFDRAVRLTEEEEADERKDSAEM